MDFYENKQVNEEIRSIFSQDRPSVKGFYQDYLGEGAESRRSDLSTQDVQSRMLGSYPQPSSSLLPQASFDEFQHGRKILGRHIPPPNIPMRPAPSAERYTQSMLTRASSQAQISERYMGASAPQGMFPRAASQAEIRERYMGASAPQGMFPRAASQAEIRARMSQESQLWQRETPSMRRPILPDRAPHPDPPRARRSNEMECAFCKRNGDRKEFYKSHDLKDSMGKVVCPILRKHVCETCGATGSKAHTRSYCPFNDSSNMVALKMTRRNSSSMRTGANIQKN